VHAALLVVQIAFASQAVESKIAMAPREAGGEALSPETVAMVRMLGAAVFFQVYALAKRLPVPNRRDSLHLFGLSALGITLNQMLFLSGLKRTSPFVAALLAVVIPVATAGLAALFGKEKLTLRTALGLGVAGVGVVYLTGIHAVDIGAVLVLVNCVFYAAYLVFSRELIQRLGALVVITWIFTWGALSFAPLGVPALLGSLPTLTARGGLFFAYVVAIPTITAYLLNAWALGRSTPTLVTVYIHLQPVLAALLAWVQLGSGLSERMIVASVFILVGVVVVATRPTGERVVLPVATSDDQ
jgi:drug/metabolite transporter (DMT)-like permease